MNQNSTPTPGGGWGVGGSPTPESRAAKDRAASGLAQLVGVALHALDGALLRDPLAADSEARQCADNSGHLRWRRLVVLAHADEAGESALGIMDAEQAGSEPLIHDLAKSLGAPRQTTLGGVPIPVEPVGQVGEILIRHIVS